jgi:hypothetical protein
MEKKQKTLKGYEIPVPSRVELEDNLKSEFNHSKK